MSEQVKKTAVKAVTNGEGPEITNITPVITRFVPNDLAKGMAGMAVAFLACAYTAKKFNDSGREVVREAFRQIVEETQKS